MFQKSIRIIYRLLIFNTLTFSIGLKAQVSIDSIIQNHLKVTGLANLTQEIKDFSMEGKLLKDNIGFPISIKGIVPEKYRMDMIFKQRDFIKISNGTTVWEHNPFTDTTTVGKCTNFEAQTFIDRLCGSLEKYKSGSISVRFIETTTIDDIEVYKLEFKDKGQSQIYFIDKYSYLILRIDDDIVENKMTYYSDYRKVGKYYLPFSLTGYENGMPVMSMKFDNIKINSGIPETVFSKPD
jgi:outer membrane lipoprotein-sorting protein